MKILIITSNINDAKPIAINNTLKNILGHDSAMINETDVSLTIDYAMQFDCVISVYQTSTAVMLKPIL